jgi:hypothetical protein
MCGNWIGPNVAQLLPQAMLQKENILNPKVLSLPLVPFSKCS